MRKKAFLISLLLTLLLVAFSAQAQDVPPQMDIALQLLSQEVGQTVTIGDLREWDYVQSEFPDTSLGCPLDGQAYAQVLTDGFAFTLSYAALLYDIRVSADGNIAFVCSVVPDPEAGVIPTDDGSATVAPTALPALTATPIPLPIPTGTVLTPIDVFPVELRVCPPLAPRMQIGAQGRVIADTTIPNNVRSRPGLSGTLVGQIPAGDVFTVIGGPICASNYTWWRVNYNGLIGWTAEGEAGDYYLEPVGEVTPPPADRPDITITNAALAAELAQLQGTFSDTVVWSPIGTTVALADERGVLLYDVTTLNTEPRVIPIPAPVTAAAFRPDGLQLVIGDNAGRIHLVDVAAGTVSTTLQAHIPAVSDIEFSPDGTLFVTAKAEAVGTTDTDSAIKFWDATTGQLVRESTGYTQPILSIDISPDALQLASGDTAGAVYLWDTATGQQQFLLQGHTVRVNAVSFSPDGALLASGGDDGVIQLYDVASSPDVVGVVGTLTSASGRAVFDLAFSPDSTLLASAGGDLIAPSQDNAVRLYNVSLPPDQVIEVIDLLGHTNVVTSIAFSPDATALASVSTDGTVRFWGVTPFQPVSG